MATDASIYGNIRQPKPVNMLADYANMMQLEGAQQQNAMNRMAMGEKVRGIERQNKLASLLESTPQDQIEPALMRGGFMSEAMAFGENKAKRAKADADARSASLGAKEKEIELVGRTFGFLKDKPTPENASFMLEFLEGQGLMPAPQVQQFKTLFAGNPDKIGLFAEQMFRQALSAKDQLHKTETRDAGGFVQTTATDPVSLKQTVIGQTAKTVSPDAQLSAQTSTANNQRSVGAQYANAAATREIAGATRDAARIKANQDVEMKLGDDYRTQSKGFKEVSDAYRTINATLDKATTSPAATLAGATKFMKLLDPGSVVRESELGMALAATGVFDRAANYFNTLRSGKVLTANQVADFKNITGQIYQAAQQGQQQLDAHYRQQAKTYGLRPEMIVQNLGQNTSAPVDLGSLPAGGGKVVDFGSLK